MSKSESIKREIEALNKRIQDLESNQSQGEGWLQSQLDSVLDGIITIDVHGKIQSFNRAAEEIFGYEAAEVTGQPVNILMPEPYRSEHEGYVSRYLETGEAQIIGKGREVQGRRQDGSTFPMDLAVTEFTRDGARIFTGIVRNIAERKRLEEQLIQSSKLASLGELVGGIAHEINNPAGIILMRAASLMRAAKEEDCPPEVIEDIEVIQRQCEKVAQITSGLLAFSRESPFDPQAADANVTVRSAIELIENVIKNRKIEIRVDLDADLPIAEFDTTRIEQVMLNLINNAMDAMPEGGRLTVRTESVSEGSLRWVRISVEDDGTGIPREHMDRLFDPFFTTKEVGKGTGLGLAISYGIVQEHGGRLEVESEPEKGSAFHVYLPEEWKLV